MTEESNPPQDFDHEEHVVLPSRAPVCGGESGNPNITSSVEPDTNDDVMRKEENPETLESIQMEDLIDKILEKYGENSEGRRERSSVGHSTKSDIIVEKSENEERFDDYSRIDSTRRPHHTDWKTDSRIERDRLIETRRRPEMSESNRVGEEREGEGIGSVIRSQSGVTRQLSGVSEGLDGLSDDLERMKKELERVQKNAYAVQLSGQFGGETIRDTSSVLDTGTPSYSIRDLDTDTKARGTTRYSIIDLDTDTKARGTSSYSVRDFYTDTKARGTTSYSTNDNWNDFRTNEIQNKSGYERTSSRWDPQEVRKRPEEDNQWKNDLNIWADDRKLEDTGTYHRSWKVRYDPEESKPSRISRHWDYDDLLDRDRGASESYQLSNEWTEERDGILRLGDSKDTLHLEPKRSFHGSSSIVPGRGRSQIRESDVQLTHLLTLAEPRWDREALRGADRSSPSPAPAIDPLGRRRRPTDQGVFTLSESSSSGVQTTPRRDGYCYMCEEFEGGSRRTPSVNTTSRHHHHHPSDALLTLSSTTRVPHRSLSISGLSSSSTTYRTSSELDLPPTTSERTSYQRFKSVEPETTYSSAYSSSYSYLSQPQTLPPHTTTTTTTTAKSLHHKPAEFTSRFLAKVRSRRKSLGEKTVTRTQPVYI